MASVAVALELAPASAAQATKPSPRPYRLIDAGTLGGPQSFLDLPGIPIARNGALVGTADTSVADSDYPNFNPFVIGFPDPFTAHAFSYRNGHMSDLGALPGNNSSAVFQVNGNGVGAGLSETGAIDPITGWPAQHAVIFTNGEVTDIGTLPGGHESLAVSINDRGQVAGFGNNGTEDPYSPEFFGNDWGTQTRSFVWRDGVMHDIGTLGGPDALMTTMNARGQITGNSFTSSTPTDTTGIPTLDPFIWEKGRMRDLGSLGGNIGFANWMNNAGQVAGFSTFAGDETGHAFLWNGRRMLDLGTLGGDFSWGNYLNDEGHVTGGAYLPDGTTYHAYIWAGGKMRDLPPPDGAPCSDGFAINNRDDVVGVADDCEGNQLAVVLWHKGVPYDLSTLIPPTQLTLGEFEYINDRGELVGRATLPSGDVHEVMLVPASRGGQAALATLRPQGPSASAQADRHAYASDHRMTYGGGEINRLLAKIAFGWRSALMG